MTPGARLAALMELVDHCQNEWRQEEPLPAEHLFKAYCRTRRYIGSKDRRALQDALFTLLRRHGVLLAKAQAAGMEPDGRGLTLLWRHAEGDGLAVLSALCAGEGYMPAPLSKREREVFSLPAPEQESALRPPDWLATLLRQDYGAESDGLLRALGQPAPLDLRVNRLKSSREAVKNALAAEGIASHPVDGLPDALTVPARAAVTSTHVYREGRVEVQDRASQAVLSGLPLCEGMTVIDYCAGGGGKALALAAALNNRCRLFAHDVDPKRLRDLPFRAARAGASCITVEHDPARLHAADLLLLDAPCSGTGTIRRHPDLPWRLTPQRLDRYRNIQAELLREAAPKVKEGGYLLYVTCSLLAVENECQINLFLGDNPNFQVVALPKVWNNSGQESPYRRFGPHRHHSDGFFAALLHKPG